MGIKQLKLAPETWLETPGSTELLTGLLHSHSYKWDDVAGGERIAPEIAWMLHMYGSSCVPQIAWLKSCLHLDSVQMIFFKKKKNPCIHSQCLSRTVSKPSPTNPFPTRTARLNYEGATFGVLASATSKLEDPWEVLTFHLSISSSTNTDGK